MCRSASCLSLVANSGEISSVASGSPSLVGTLTSAAVEPARGAADLVAAAGGGGVDAFGVLHRAELFGRGRSCRRSRSSPAGSRRRRTARASPRWACRASPALPVSSTYGTFFSARCQGSFSRPPLVEPLDERDAQRVDRDRAGVERQACRRGWSACASASGRSLYSITCSTPSPMHEVADLFQRRRPWGSSCCSSRCRSGRAGRGTAGRSRGRAGCRPGSRTGARRRACFMSASAPLLSSARSEPP